MALGSNEVLINGEVRQIDIWIESSDTYVQNNTKYAAWYVPGNVFAFRAGTRPQLKILDLKGTADEPMIFCNKGKVVLETTNNYGIVFQGGEHIKVFGNTDPDIPDTYGIEIAKVGSGGMGMNFRSKSEYIEVAYVEVHDTGFCGMMAKTDGEIGWVMHDVHFHHNFVHDTHGEGFYVGETKYPSHTIENVKIHNNLIVRTGWELFQFSNCQGLEIYNNTCWDGGILNENSQNKGLQVSNDSGDVSVRDNVIGRTRSNFLINLSAFNVDFNHNYFDGDNTIASPGVFADEREPSIPDSPIVYQNNWMRSYKDALFQMYNNVNDNIIKDNIYDDNGSNAEFIIYGGGSGPNHVTITGNIEQTIEQIQFVDPANNDYRIKPGTFYADKGIGFEEGETPPPVLPPPPPTNLVAIPDSNSAISLSWQNADPGASFSDAWGIRIERSVIETTGYTLIFQSDITDQPITSYIDTGLTENTTYYYKVRNYNDAGNSIYSNVASATTTEPVNPPAAPTNLVATGVTEAQINLSWQDNSDNESGFVIERNSVAGFIQIGSVGIDQDFFSDTGLQASSVYEYRVKAVSPIGDSDYSNAATGTTTDETGPGGIITVRFIYGPNNVYKGDVKGAVGQVPVEDGDQVINNLVITNITFVSGSSSLTDAQNTAQAQKLQNPAKFVWIDPEPIETQLVEV